MSTVKVVGGILFAAILAIWIFAAISSPIIQIKTITPQRQFSDEIEITTTVYNFSPFEKGIVVSDNSAVPVLLIDGQVPPEVDHTSISETVKFAPFSNKTITTKVILSEASNSTTTPIPQLIGTDARALTVTPGTHKVEAAWGGYTSNAINFSVN